MDKNKDKEICKKNSHKTKKSFYVFYSEFKMATLINMVCPTMTPQIPLVHGKLIKGKININIFDLSDQSLDVSKVKYLYITVPETVLKLIDVKDPRYKFKGEKIKIVSTIKLPNAGVDRKKIRIPISIFRLMVREQDCDTTMDMQRTTNSRLYNIFNYCYDVKNIELVDENKKHLAYMIINVDV